MFACTECVQNLNQEYSPILQSYTSSIILWVHTVFKHSDSGQPCLHATRWAHVLWFRELAVDSRKDLDDTGRAKKTSAMPNIFVGRLQEVDCFSLSCEQHPPTPYA